MTNNIETLRAALTEIERAADALRIEIDELTPRDWVGNRVALTVTLREARRAQHPGDCADDVAALAAEPHIAARLDALDADALIEELREYDAWSDEELADHKQNQRRLLWIVCGDTIDTAI